MDLPASAPEAELELLASRLSVIEQRLDRLELQAAPPTARPAGAGDEPPRFAVETAAGLEMPDVGSIVGLVGRTLFVLAGAFLLRALTDSGRLGAGSGILIGFAFAATWIAMADRAGRLRQSASAAFHGLAFVLIVFPLLFEATSHFHFLGARGAAVGLGCGTAIGLAVAWRRHLQIVAWVASLGGLAAAGALAVTTQELGPFAIFAVLLGVAALWMGYVLDWKLLRWPVAVFANLAIMILSIRAVTVGAIDKPPMAFVAQVLLLAAYLGSFATRTLLLNRNVIPFEVAQSIAAAIVGLGGAVVLTSIAGGSRLPLGAAILALAAGCYGAAAIFVDRRVSRRRNYYFYTSAALVFALTGGALAVSSPNVGPLFAVLGVVSVWVGRLSNRITYRAHGAVYLVAAVVVSGLLRYVLYGLGLPVFLGLPSGPGVPAGLNGLSEVSGRASVSMLGVLALCGAALPGMRLEAGAGALPPMRRVPRLIVLLLLVGGLLGTAVSWALIQPDSLLGSSPGLVATVRTALLVASILALAFASRQWADVEGGWLVYPLLILTGVKLLLEDFRAGRPATLFIGFALYGLALVVGPRLRRHQGASG